MSNYPTVEYRNRRLPLFQLEDGTEVFYGDVLWHPDKGRVGWCCKAEFRARNERVTVRSPNGAVPNVAVADLRKEPPRPPPRCSECGQFLP